MSKIYHCGDRMCGGADCADCYGEAAAAEYVREQEEIDPLDITDTMARCGGSFVQALAHAWRKADPINREKIQKTWSAEWTKYTAMTKRIKEEI